MCVVMAFATDSVVGGYHIYQDNIIWNAEINLELSCYLESGNHEEQVCTHIVGILNRR